MLIANLKTNFPGNDFVKIFNDLKISEKIRSEDLKLEDWKGIIKKYQSN